MSTTLIYLAIAVVIGIAISLEKKPKKRKEARARPKAPEKPWERLGFKRTFTEPPPEPQKKFTSPYRDKFELLNAVELTLYERLVEATPALIVFSQVSMSQILFINERTRGRWPKLKEIGWKSVDFLIVRREDTSIVAAIELNGRHHENAVQIAKDKVKRNALEQAGIPLIVIEARNIPDVTNLRKLLAPHIVARRNYESERDARLHR